MGFGPGASSYGYTELSVYFPGDGHLSGTSSGYIKEFMYFSGAGHRDKWISFSH